MRIEQARIKRDTESRVLLVCQRANLRDDRYDTHTSIENKRSREVCLYTV